MSSLRIAAAPARERSDFSRAEQEFVLPWGRVIANDNAELAFQVTSFSPEALRLMEPAAVETWSLYAMELYDTKGQMPAVKAFQEVVDLAANRMLRLAGVALDQVQPVLERFVWGPNGRTLQILPGEQAATDTESIFLPGVVSRLADKEDNFRLYTAMAMYRWARTWYGTWGAAGSCSTGFSGAVSTTSTWRPRTLWRPSDSMPADRAGFSQSAS